ALRRERPLGHAARVLLLPDLPLAAALELQVLADGVDRGDADAVQAGGDLVARVVELSAGVEDGHDDLGRAHAPAVHAHGDAAAVVLDADGAVEVDADGDDLAVSGEVLVDGVV